MTNWTGLRRLDCEECTVFGGCLRSKKKGGGIAKQGNSGRCSRFSVRHRFKNHNKTDIFELSITMRTLLSYLRRFMTLTMVGISMRKIQNNLSLVVRSCHSPRNLKLFAGRMQIRAPDLENAWTEGVVIIQISGAPGFKEVTRISSITDSSTRTAYCGASLGVRRSFKCNSYLTTQRNLVRYSTLGLSGISSVTMCKRAM